MTKAERIAAALGAAQAVLEAREAEAADLAMRIKELRESIQRHREWLDEELAAEAAREAPRG